MRPGGLPVRAGAAHRAGPGALAEVRPTTGAPHGRGGGVGGNAYRASPLKAREGAEGVEDEVDGAEDRCGRRAAVRSFPGTRGRRASPLLGRCALGRGALRGTM